MRKRSAAPLLRFLDRLGNDEADRFIADLELLLTCIREERPSEGS
jgi:hypothetical protein